MRRGVERSEAMAVSETKQASLPSGVCAACQTSTASCRACTRQRNHALRLYEQDGLTDPQIAARLGIGIPRVRRLLEEAGQLRDLEHYKIDSIPLAAIRELVEQRLKDDPTLTQTRLAKLLQTDRTELRRALGLQPTAARTINGEHRPGRVREEITVEMAGRIVQALGIPPHEIPGL
jgi:DNA-binding transcriptional regulator LsrR (DeoR family)